ncbi:hypothetical protein QE419_002622 [Brevundimonas vesicularis]|nr:hypothetical protein [Brevundimonas vesicularis]MDQ1193856.1 hypothetical protein [Brevundimonas vesicularis]
MLTPLRKAQLSELLDVAIAILEIGAADQWQLVQQSKKNPVCKLNLVIGDALEKRLSRFGSEGFKPLEGCQPLLRDLYKTRTTIADHSVATDEVTIMKRANHAHNIGF